jgi:hypothetical protein
MFALGRLNAFDQMIHNCNLQCAISSDFGAFLSSKSDRTIYFNAQPCAFVAYCNQLSAFMHIALFWFRIVT